MHLTLKWKAFPLANNQARQSIKKLQIFILFKRKNTIDAVNASAPTPLFPKRKIFFLFSPNPEIFPHSTVKFHLEKNKTHMYVYICMHIYRLLYFTRVQPKYINRHTKKLLPFVYYHLLFSFLRALQIPSYFFPPFTFSPLQFQ